MELIPAISAGAALSSVALSVAVLLSGKRSVARGCFAVGMWMLAARNVLGGMVATADAGEASLLSRAAFLMDTLLPAVWIGFSLTYSRDGQSDQLRRARYLLIAALVTPVLLAAGLSADSILAEPAADGGVWLRYGVVPQAFEVVVLTACIVVVANLERTLRAAVGTTRWRIQYVFTGLCVICGARVYTATQGILFGGRLPELAVVESVALLTGCVLIIVAWLRKGFSAMEIYPSRRLLQGSATVLLAGTYLLILGALAQITAHFGGTVDFALQTIVVTGGLAVLAVLLLSRRVQRRLRALVSRHLRRPQYDSRAVWTRFTNRLPVSSGEEEYCREAVRLVAETFQVLSVSLWQPDAPGGMLLCRAITNGRSDGIGPEDADPADAAAILEAIRDRQGPFDLERESGPWAEALRRLHEPHFRSGGNRLCVPLVSNGRAAGLLILADRVDGVPYSLEELDLLRCAGGQIAAGLSQHRLTAELMQGRELEAFQAMSTFFIHDLKNAAAGLDLTLANLPVHFDNPEFREDALRMLRTTAGRIQQITTRLSSLRRSLSLNLEKADLNALVRECMKDLHGLREVEIAEKLQPLPPVMADRGQIGTVVTNLLLNAREAVSGDGRITIETALQEGKAVLSVEDNGCGMPASFVRESLFRPFRTTKKRGLGIGMFQSRMIVEAHHGKMAVQSREGRGTIFRISLPVLTEPA